MHLDQIILTQFKNYQFQKIEPSAKLNFVVGNNGMGKTNLLDAIYFLCMGKSYFVNNDRYLSLKGTDLFRLEGAFKLEGQAEKIVAKVQPGKKKVFERNDLAYERLMDHVGLLPVVIIAPDDTALAMEGSEERRKFLNNTLCQIDAGYLKALVRYNKILQQRNALLKQNEGRPLSDKGLIEIYDEQLADVVPLIFNARKQLIEDLTPVFQDYQGTISKEQESVGCRYRSQLIDRNFRELLSENLEKDVLLQRTTVGIHKDELVFTVEDQPIKRFASQGQRKTFIMALKLAQYELLRRHKEITPLLLLDDVFDKLDPSRVHQLIDLILQDTFGQVFISDTHIERLPEIAAQLQAEFRIFKIIDGTVTTIQAHAQDE